MIEKEIRLSPEIIDAIDEEFAYQAKIIANNGADGVDHGVASQLVTLDTYTRSAIDAWTNNSSERFSLDQLRKVAAIALRALELYGCPTRGGDYVHPLEVREAQERADLAQ